MYIIDLPEISPKDIITFEHGLPGFEFYKQFVIMNIHEFQPFQLLYSCEKNRDELKFVIIDSLLIKKTYNCKLSKNDLKDISAENGNDVSLFFIVTINKDNISHSTANLMGPLAVNLKAKKGKQLLIEDYKQHSQFKLLAENDQAEGK